MLLSFVLFFALLSYKFTPTPFSFYFHLTQHLSLDPLDLNDHVCNCVYFSCVYCASNLFSQTFHLSFTSVFWGGGVRGGGGGTEWVSNSTCKLFLFSPCNCHFPKETRNLFHTEYWQYVLLLILLTFWYACVCQKQFFCILFRNSLCIGFVGFTKSALAFVILTVFCGL